MLVICCSLFEYSWITQKCNFEEENASLTSSFYCFTILGFAWLSYEISQSAALMLHANGKIETKSCHVAGYLGLIPITRERWPHDKPTVRRTSSSGDVIVLLWPTIHSGLISDFIKSQVVGGSFSALLKLVSGDWFRALLPEDMRRARIPVNLRTGLSICGTEASDICEALIVLHGPSIVDVDQLFSFWRSESQNWPFAVALASEGRGLGL